MNWKERARLYATSILMSVLTSGGINLYMAKHPIVLHPKAAINAVEDITKLDALPTLDHGHALDEARCTLAVPSKVIGPGEPAACFPTGASIAVPAGPATVIGSTLSVTEGPLVITIPLATEVPTAAPAAEPVLPAVVAEPAPVQPAISGPHPEPASVKAKRKLRHHHRHHRRAPCACICHPEFMRF